MKKPYWLRRLNDPLSFRFKPRHGLSYVKGNKNGAIDGGRSIWFPKWFAKTAPLRITKKVDSLKGHFLTYL